MALEVTSTQDLVMYDFEPTNTSPKWVLASVYQTGGAVVIDSFNRPRFTPDQFRAFIKDLQRLEATLDPQR